MARKIIVPTFPQESFEKYFEKVKLDFERAAKAGVLEDVKEKLKSQAAKEFANKHTPSTVEDIHKIIEWIDAGFDEEDTIKEGREMLSDLDTHLDNIWSDFDESLDVIIFGSRHFEFHIQLTMFGPDIISTEEYDASNCDCKDRSTEDYLINCLLERLIANLNNAYTIANSCVRKIIKI